MVLVRRLYSRTDAQEMMRLQLQQCRRLRVRVDRALDRVFLQEAMAQAQMVAIRQMAMARAEMVRHQQSHLLCLGLVR